MPPLCDSSQSMQYQNNDKKMVSVILVAAIIVVAQTSPLSSH
ncbi:hypothetical protein VHARVF571_110098 [Vibrio harveyi]|nr:hypothetical protein VHARVF571_110098 [Vibrio harveyi]